MNRIAIIIVYFGSFPNYFKLWLKSASYNKIDFLFFTDNDCSNYDLPDNVYIFQSNIEDIRSRIKKVVQDDTISCDSPYKLCDYKIFYSKIFSEKLTEYEFWGYGDIDLVWGDALKDITLQDLEEYDKFFVKGHFCFYKNDEYCRNLYCSNRLSSFFSYSYITHTDYCCHYDELDEWQDVFYNDNKKVFDKKSYADISYRKKAFTLAEQLEDISRGTAPQIYCWDKGRLFQFYLIGDEIKKKEVTYIHLQKRIMKLDDELNLELPILIAPNIFLNIDYKNITAELIKYYSKEPFLWGAYQKKRLKILMDKIKKGGIKYKIDYFRYRRKER